LNGGNPHGGADQACPAHYAERVDPSRDREGFARSGRPLQEHQVRTCTIEGVDKVLCETSLLSCEGSKGFFRLSIPGEVHRGIVMSYMEAVAVEHIGYCCRNRFGGFVLISKLPALYHLSQQEAYLIRKPVNPHSVSLADDGFAQRIREYPQFSDYSRETLPGLKLFSGSARELSKEQSKGE
jgi:hypothetical protein